MNTMAKIMRLKTFKLGHKPAPELLDTKVGLFEFLLDSFFIYF